MNGRYKETAVTINHVSGAAICLKNWGGQVYEEIGVKSRGDLGSPSLVRSAGAEPLDYRN